MYTDPYSGKLDWGNILGDTGSNFMQMMMLKKLLGGGGQPQGQPQMPQSPVPQGMMGSSGMPAGNPQMPGAAQADPRIMQMIMQLLSSQRMGR